MLMSMSMSMSLFDLNANVLRLNEDRHQRRSKWDFNLDLKVSRLTDIERSSVDIELHTVGLADTRKLLVPSFV